MAGKRTMAKVNYDALPFFVSTAEFMRFTRRDPRAVKKWLASGYLPPRTALNVRNLGWHKEDIVKWLRKHPDAVRSVSNGLQRVHRDA